ncbi:MAG: DUF475 domain-containing protein [Kineosporiaceae bacterium]|nr:DUF475 domain-containing protein [Kineosporiaceae bacterium]
MEVPGRGPGIHQRVGRRPDRFRYQRRLISHPPADPGVVIDTLRFFRWDMAAAAVSLAVATWYGGVTIAAITGILIIVEIVFSFDNAAVNAKYLAKLSESWQRIFLTVGVLIAVFGMRLVFPFVVVCVACGITPAEAGRLVLEKGDPHVPGTYGYVLNSAHPAIAAFGGMFLFLLFLDFLFDNERDSTWLGWIEKPLIRAGRLDTIAAAIALVTLLTVAKVLAEPGSAETVLIAGVAGIATYLAVNGLASAMEEREETLDEEFNEVGGEGSGAVKGLVGSAAFSLFLFLEVLDASFSFDGVIGAFAITSDPLVIALGLGVGAFFVRSMTVYLVRRGALAEYRYLEHGAHWAIGALAVLLLITLKVEIPDMVIGLVGIVFIFAAWRSSVSANRHDMADGVESSAHGIYTSS